MTTELAFHETLVGAFAWGQTDPRSGAVEGKKGGIEFGFDGTITMTDLDRFIADPNHDADFGGRYMGNLFAARGLPEPVMVSGVFQFMAPGFGAPRLMVHKHVLRSGNDLYTFRGTKFLDDDPLAFDAIGDLTTLYSTLEDANGEVVAAGVLHFPMIDFPALVASFRSSGSDDPLTARMKFLKLFLREELYVILSGFRPPRIPEDRRRALASDPAHRKQHYDVVIIGSGYGGGVAAARLAGWSKNGAKKSVCVLERGKEMRAGDFPAEPWQLAGELRTQKNPSGLLEYVVGGDMEALVGNGLGGTSLINANVMLIPEPAVFQEAGWPANLPDLAPYYQRALDVIQPSPHPVPPVKSLVLREAVNRFAKSTNQPAPPFDIVPIAVNFVDNHDRLDTGNRQDACVNCGGCVTGCNYTAKNTVDMNYLSIAQREGAEIYVLTEVLGIGRQGAGYEVHVRDGRTGQESIIGASQVVLAAGTFGTFRVLKKSEADFRLDVPTACGIGFTGNGDVLGFGYDTHEAAAPQSGPTITSRVSYKTDPDVKNHFIIEDGGLPQAVTAILRAALPFVKHTHGPNDRGIGERLRDWVHSTADFVGLTSFGALQRSIVYLGMGTEQNEGQLYMEGDDVKINWPGVAQQPFAQRIDDHMEQLTYAIHGEYVKNPEPRSFLRQHLVTAHPLGGCPMGTDPAQSVVDVSGSMHGHPGTFFIADGSILPTALGVNPALTISALAEHIMEGITQGW